MPFTIDQAKWLAEGLEWILLVRFTFLNGDTFHVATRDLVYDGQSYMGVLQEQELERVMAMSESGVDLPPTLTLRMADANAYVLLNYELQPGRGFRGAKVRAALIFRNALTGETSTDQFVRFVGVCDPATATSETILEVRAIHRINANKRMLPPFLIQRHCSKIRPLTASQCAEASDEDSDFWWCGITDPGRPDCHNTRAGCIAADNFPRFMGITYAPARSGGKGKEYTSGAHVQLFNSSNDAKYGEPWPLVLGRGWTEAPILNVQQNGNYTVIEVGLCVDHIDTGYSSTVGTRVIVNGYEIPPGGYDTGSGWASLNPGDVGWWNWLTRGWRDGLSVSDVANRHGGKADPYGSLTTIEVTVPRNVSSGEQIPQVSVLFSGPDIRVYSDASNFTSEWSNNPMWVLLWVLAHSNWHYDELDIASFVSAAAVCDEGITFQSQYGGTKTHARYGCNLVLRQRRAASDVIRGIRTNCNAMLQPNKLNGLLSVAIKGTLAAEQPAVIQGSNWPWPIASITRDGTPANGYVAFRFNEDNTLFVRGIPRPITDTPNRLQFQIQDSENNFAPTSISMADVDDVERVGQEVAGSIPAEGVPNYDQANRLARMLHAEAKRGNPAGDTRGTQWYDLQGSIEALRVAAGNIVMVDWPRLGLDDQLMRVTSVSGPNNDGLMSFTMHWHYDGWYQDELNQRPDPEYSNPRRDQLLRASYPPAPDMVAPRTGDPLFSVLDKNFAMGPNWIFGADGTWTGQILIRTKVGVNEFGEAQPPQVEPQANTSAGAIPVGTYYVGISARDSAGFWSPLSLLSETVLLTPGTITVPVLWWDTATASHGIFAGKTPFRLTLQDQVVGTPASVAVTTFHERNAGAPDQELDALAAMGRVVRHSGPIGAQILGVAAGTIQIGGTGWVENLLAGYELSVVARWNGGELPIWNYAITASTSSGALAVTPDPVVDGLEVGDVVVVRSKPVITNSGKTWTDPAWHNPLSNTGLGMNPDDEVGKVGYIVAGRGRGLSNRVESATPNSHTFAADWIIQPDATSRMIIVDPEWLSLSSPYRPISNPDINAEITLSFDLKNWVRQTMLVGLRTMDGNENPSVDQLNPVRELYVIGEPQGVVRVSGEYHVRREDRTVLVDTTAEAAEIYLLPTAAADGLPFLVKLVTPGTEDDPAGPYDATVFLAEGDSMDGATEIYLRKQWQDLAITATNA